MWLVGAWLAEERLTGVWPVEAWPTGVWLVGVWPSEERLTGVWPAEAWPAGGVARGGVAGTGEAHKGMAHGVTNGAWLTGRGFKAWLTGGVTTGLGGSYLLRGWEVGVLVSLSRASAWVTGRWRSRCMGPLSAAPYKCEERGL